MTEQKKPWQMQCLFADCRGMVQGHDTALFGVDGAGGVVGKQKDNMAELDILKERVITKRNLKVFLYTFIPSMILLTTACLLFWADTRMTTRDVVRNTGTIQNTTKEVDALKIATAQLREQYIALDKSVTALNGTVTTLGSTMVSSTKEIMAAIQQSKRGSVMDRGY